MMISHTLFVKLSSRRWRRSLLLMFLLGQGWVPKVSCMVSPNGSGT